MTDPLGQSQVIPYLEGLSAMGHEIFLLSCEKRAADHSAILSLKKYLDTKGIRWSYLNYTKRPPVISTLFDVINIRKRAKKIAHENNIETVHCRGYITALAGMRLKKKSGLRFVFDMRGFFADERVEGGLWNLKNPVYKWVYQYFKKKERLFFTHADHSVSLTEKGKGIIQSWNLPGQPIPVEVIPCCADLDLFNPKNAGSADKAKWKEKLGIHQSDFVISYLGSIGTWYMLEEMLDFFRMLKNSRPNAKFLFITSENKTEISEKAGMKNISADDIIVQKADRKDVPVLLSLSHISIFFIKPVFSKSASSPTKMGEIMGMGIPLICNSGVGDVDDIMIDSGAGILLNSFEEEEYLKAIEKLEKILIIPPENIRKYAEKYFSLSDGVKKYNSIYKSLS